MTKLVGADPGQTNSDHKRRWHWQPLLIVLVAFCLQVVSINLVPLDFDEGVHILTARFIQQGYRPYSEVYISRQPLFVLIFQAIWVLSGQNVFFSKVIFAGLNSLFLGAIGYLGLRWLSEAATQTGLLLLLVSPGYIVGSIALMADQLSVTLATFALLLIMVYLERERRQWLLGAGFFLAAGLSVKLLVVPIALVVLALLAARWHSSLKQSDLKTTLKDIGYDTLWLAGGFAMLAVPLLFVFDQRLVYNSSVALRLTLRETRSLDLTKNLSTLSLFLVDNLFFSFGAFLSLVFNLKKFERTIGYLTAWLFLSLGWLLIQIPLREQHTAVLGVPLIWLAGWGWLQARNALPPFSQRRLGKRLTLATLPGSWLSNGTNLLLVLLVVGYLFFSWVRLPGMLDRARDIAVDLHVRQYAIRPQLIHFLKQITKPEDCVISDDTRFALDLERYPPPNLAEPSFARIEGGQLTLELIQRAATEFRCQAIISTANRFSRIPGLWQWADHYFEHHLEIEGIILAYNEPDRPPVELDQTFVNLVRLAGYSLNMGAMAPDGTVRLELYWQPIGKLTGQEKVFVQVRNRSGETVAQADHILFEDPAPGNLSGQSDLIHETANLKLTLPLIAAQAPYNLYVGLYDPATLERFPLLNDQSGEQAVIIPLGPLLPGDLP